MSILVFLCRSSSGVQSQPPCLLVQLHALLFWWSCAVWGHAGRASCSTFDQQHQRSACFDCLVNVRERERDWKREKGKQNRIVRGPLQTQICQCPCVLASLKQINNEVLLVEMWFYLITCSWSSTEWNREVIEFPSLNMKSLVPSAGGTYILQLFHKIHTALSWWHQALDRD